MSGMRFKGFVGAMDVAAALDSLARGVAAGVIRHAPFGGEYAPLEFSQTAHLAFKVSAHKDKAKIALKLRTGPRPGRDAARDDECCAFPCLAARATGTDAAAPRAAQAVQDEPFRLKLKAKGNAPVCEAAALIHGLAAGLAAGDLLLRTGDEEVRLSPGPVLKLSLKGKDASLGVKLSWKIGMEDAAEPLPQLFTEPEAAAAVPAPGARTDELRSGDDKPTPLPKKDFAPAARCCAAPGVSPTAVVSPSAAPVAAPNAVVAPSASPSASPAAAAPKAHEADTPAKASDSKHASPASSTSSSAPSSAPSSTSSSTAKSTSSSAPSSSALPGDPAPATLADLPPEAGIPAQESVAAIVAAVAEQEQPAPRPKASPAPAARKAAKAPAKTSATPKAKASAKAPAAKPAKQPRPAAAPLAKKPQPAKARKP